MRLGQNLRNVLGGLFLLAPLEAGALIVVRDLPAAECGESVRTSQSTREFVSVNEQQPEATPCTLSSTAGVEDVEAASLQVDREHWSPLDLIANASLPGTSPSRASQGRGSFEIPGRQELSLSPVVAVLSIPGSDELRDPSGIASVRLAGQSGSLLYTAVPAALVFLVLVALGARVVHQKTG